MPLPREIAKLIRERVESGHLPMLTVGKMYAGFGNGSSCDGCDQPIHRPQVEYEFQADDNKRTIRFHIGCAGLWEAERRRKGYLSSY